MEPQAAPHPSLGAKASLTQMKSSAGTIPVKAHQPRVLISSDSGLQVLLFPTAMGSPFDLPPCGSLPSEQESTRKCEPDDPSNRPGTERSNVTAVNYLGFNNIADCTRRPRRRACLQAVNLNRHAAREMSRSIEDRDSTLALAAKPTTGGGRLTPGGHLKVLHLWPGQTPPPGRRRNGGKLGLGCPPRNPGGGLSQSPALAFELEQVAVVHQAVE